jgi:hypothetical protein
MPAMPGATDGDTRYRDLLLEPLRKCAAYKPNFGKRDEQYDLPKFRALYKADPLYHWMGLDSDLMYAAHKAAGGMTSIYRQLGIGCERLFRAVLQDELGLSDAQVAWNYQLVSEVRVETTEEEDRGALVDDAPADSEVETTAKVRTLSLDGRIHLDDVGDAAKKHRVADWIDRRKKDLDIKIPISGAVFEVRQGYKSADSKRQNADLSNASQALSHGYLPVLAIMSTQVNEVVRTRYEVGKWVVLRGSLNDAVPEPARISTYAFCDEVVGYDLADFFNRNQGSLRTEVEAVLQTLLQP